MRRASRCVLYFAGVVELDLRLAPGEPRVAVWEPITAAALAEGVIAICGEQGSGAAVVAVDGRSGAGKTTLADLLLSHLPDATVVHTDDVAWYESFFDWDTLLREHVLVPLRDGQAVHYRPPAWRERGRSGAITVLGSQFVIVEGCGAARQSVSAFVDCVIWVQSDQVEAERRGIVRDGGTEAAARFWREWEAQEIPFFTIDKPWTRADLFVCGTPGPLPQNADVLVAGMSD